MASGWPRVVFSRGGEVLRRLGDRRAGGRVVMCVGLSERGLDSVGEVTAVVGSGSGVVSEKGQPVCEIRWQGVVDSSADEMYHSLFRYESNGVRQMRLPFACRLLELNPSLVSEPDGPGILDADREGGGWVCRVEAEEADVARAVEGGELLRREDYEAAVQAEDAAGLADDAARLQY